MVKKKIKAKRKAPKQKKAGPKPKAAKAKSKAKTAKMPAMKRKPATLMVTTQPQEKILVGRVAHFYNHISVAVVDITSGELKVGDEISIEGPHTSVKQKVASMQVEHEHIDVARLGQSIGMKVNDRVRENDNVYKIA